MKSLSFSKMSNERKLWSSYNGGGVSGMNFSSNYNGGSSGNTSTVPTMEKPSLKANKGMVKAASSSYKLSPSVRNILSKELAKAALAKNKKKNNTNSNNKNMNMNSLSSSSLHTHRHDGSGDASIQSMNTRRRFQRRGSKSASMFKAMSLNNLGLDDHHHNLATNITTTASVATTKPVVDYDYGPTVTTTTTSFSCNDNASLQSMNTKRRYQRRGSKSPSMFKALSFDNFEGEPAPQQQQLPQQPAIFPPFSIAANNNADANADEDPQSMLISSVHSCLTTDTELLGFEESATTFSSDFMEEDDIEEEDEECGGDI